MSDLIEVTEEVTATVELVERGPQGTPGDAAVAAAVAAEATARAAADAAHTADTTNVHGITDTTVLATDAEVATAVAAEATARNAAISAASALSVARADQGLWNIRWSGTPTGTNDIALIQAAYQDAIDADAGGLYLPSGIYGVPTPDILPISRDGFKVKGDGPGATILDGSGLSASGAIMHSIGTLGSDISLISNALTNTTTVVVANGSYAVGDRFKLTSTTVTGFTNQAEGEFVRVFSVAADSPSPGQTTLTLYAPLHADYLTSASAKLNKATMPTDIGVADLSFLGPNSTGLLVSGFRFDTVLDPVVHNVNARRTHYAALPLFDVIGARVSNMGIADNDGTGLAYGIVVAWACQDINIENVNGRRMRHVVTHGGGSSRAGIFRRCQSVNVNGAEMKEAAMDCHPAGEDIHWVNCTCDGSQADGFVFQGRTGSAKNMSTRNCTRHGFLIQPLTLKALSYDVEIRARRCGNKGLAFSSATGYGTIDHFHFDADIADTGSDGVYINDTQEETVTGLTAGRVKVRRAAGYSMRISKANGFTIGELDLGIGAALRGLYLNDCVKGVLDAGVIDNVEAVAGATIAIDLHTCDRITVDAVQGRAAATGVKEDAATTNTKIAGGSDFGECTTPMSPGAGAGKRYGVMTDGAGFFDPLGNGIPINPQVETLTDAATFTPSASYSGGRLATLSQDTTIANPTGTPASFQRYMLRIKSTSARALTWGSRFRGSQDVALPAATSGGGLTDYYGFQWNSTDSKWDLLGVTRGF